MKFVLLSTLSSYRPSKLCERHWAGVQVWAGYRNGLLYKQESRDAVPIQDAQGL
jgi:hypothetical protein